MIWIPPVDDAGRRRLRLAAHAAAACFAANLVASLAMAAVLRHGLPVVPLGERAAWVAGHVTAWRLGWATWMIAAPALVVFYAAFARTLTPSLRLATLAAVGVAVLGLTADLSAELAFVAVLPAQYAQLPPGVGEGVLAATQASRAILAAEARATLLTGALANGLYTVAGLMLTWAAWLTPGFPRRLCWWSLPGWVAGLGLTVSALARHTAATAVTTALTMGGFLVWQGLLILELRRRATPAPAPPSSP